MRVTNFGDLAVSLVTIGLQQNFNKKTHWSLRSNPESGYTKEIRRPKMQENPAISDWVPCFGGKTEGMLGGWLAQRQAALRDVMAAGARFISC